MQNLISAIIPTFNRRNYLEEAIRALLVQTHPLHEIIIWDDGSSDDTRDFLESFTKSPDIPSQTNFTFHTASNGGKSRALNAALQRATGDLIWICDDDDIALPHAAETLCTALNASGAGLVAGRHERFEDQPDTGERQLQGTGYWPDLTSGSVLRHLLEDIFFFQNATLVRRAALERVGPFREELARSIDYDMFVRLALQFPITLVDETVFLQRKHSGARGPAHARHSMRSSEIVWEQSDRDVFLNLLPQLDLPVFEAFFETESPDLRGRAARLQRACVFARRNAWDIALEDLEAAAALCPNLPLAQTERAILKRLMAGKHGCALAFRAPVADRLAGLAQSGPIGRSITHALTRAVIWRGREALRNRQTVEALRIARFTLRLGGLSAMAGNAAAASASAPALQERQSPFQEALAC